MRKRLKRRNKPHRVFINIGVFLLILIGLLVFCDTRVRPVIKRKVRDCARTETVTILNQILVEQIDTLDIDYSDIAIVKYSSDDKISSIEINTLAVNKFKASFALSITQALYKIDNFDFSLKLGTLLGPEFLTERGPKIPFSVSSSEYVQTEIISRLEEAGINQTVHKILLDVSLNICCYFPGYTTSVTVQSELTLAETVIIGTVPQFYAS